MKFITSDLNHYYVARSGVQRFKAFLDRRSGLNDEDTLRYCFIRPYKQT